MHLKTPYKTFFFKGKITCLQKQKDYGDDRINLTLNGIFVRRSWKLKYVKKIPKPLILKITQNLREYLTHKLLKFKYAMPLKALTPTANNKLSLIIKVSG